MLDKDIAERRRLWKGLDERYRALLDDHGANKLVNEEKMRRGLRMEPTDDGGR